MFSCPSCKSTLNKINKTEGVFWVCPSCNGRIVSIGIVRRVCPPDLVKLLWQKARLSQYLEKHNCPICQRKMREVAIDSQKCPLILDVCVKCLFVWFDPKEYEFLPKTEIAPSEYDKLPPEAKKQFATAILETSKEVQGGEGWNAWPDSWWEVFLPVFGFPVEHNEEAIENKPIVTWTLTGIIVLINLFAFINLEAAVMNWGLIPMDPGRHFGLTFITYFFLHAGWVHLLGNLYFLLIFGDNSEDILGKKRYLSLIVLATLAGALIHVVGDPRSTIPLVGASAGISGIITYYCLRFRQARIGLLIAWRRWVRIPVVFIFGLWLFIQLTQAFMQTSGYGNVSALSHLGGVTVGVFFWWFTKDE